MSKHQSTRARWIVLATLSVFAAVTPQASADTSLPTWTCRASAAYVELNPLLQEQRVEPVLANGFADRNNPDTDFCANADTGVQDIDLLPTANVPLLTLQSAFATTSITPSFAAARDQTAFANGGVLEPLEINLGGLNIVANAITADATGTCVAGVPTMTGQSTIVSLTINDLEIEIPDDGAPVDLNLTPLIRVRLNQQVVEGNALSAEQALTQRAAHIELLTTGVTEPVARVVIGEAKVDRTGAVCAAAPPPPTCPAGSIAEDPNATPLVCVRTVTPPCPAGSTRQRRGRLHHHGAAAVRCRHDALGRHLHRDAGHVPGRDRQGTDERCLRARRPATMPDRAALPIPPRGSASCGSRVERRSPAAVRTGGIGSSDGPRATCGRLAMRFVRGTRNLGSSFTSRFGNRTVTRGTLVTCGSNPRPIVGARIDVVHVLPGDQRRRKTGLRSRLGGLLTLILPIDLQARARSTTPTGRTSTRRGSPRAGS